MHPEDRSDYEQYTSFNLPFDGWKALNFVCPFTRKVIKETIEETFGKK